ncbi:MAG TPA: protein kinase [Thermoanaerobaculia bacterium]|nr:protein kinase [Thermoanaerobaculia bacterium]
MRLTAGTRLGPYEILAPLGSGGMGEVYRARDSKLNREVAVKVLPESIAGDRDALARFEREAHAVAALNHPNILSIFDFGSHEGTVYAVTELLEGSTLRDKLDAGALPQRRAVEMAIPIARGLAAAHEKGVVHRDLKPENVFLTDDGRVKILDFGLAKKIGPADAATNAPTTPAGTEPGTVMGTVGYMSPEQVRGRDVDHRSDIFSFGAVFYEMLSGRRAFRGESAVETMSAILREEPSDLVETGRSISPSLDRIVRHCLEKSPSARFQSAGDIAFDLEALSGTSQSQPVLASRARSRFSWKIPAAIALAAALVGIGFWIGGRGRRPTPSFQQLTFQRGTIIDARFAPDGNTIVYGASWAGRPFETFTVRPESQLSRSLGFGGDLLGISRSSLMAISLGRHFISSFDSSGTLADASLSGGVPRQILESVEWADWGPDGKTLAVVRRAGTGDRLEYPIGKTIFTSTGWVGRPRFSPAGDRIALEDHPFFAGDSGDLVMIDTAGKTIARSGVWNSLEGLCWSADGREVWFTAIRRGGNRRLWALTPSGRERLLLELPGILTIHDADRGGRVLLARDNMRVGAFGEMSGDAAERDLSYLDYTAVRDLSVDGKTLLFDEDAEGGGPTGSIYALRAGDSSPVRLGDGNSFALSPDGKWALTLPSLQPTDQFHAVLVPTGVGTPVSLPANKGTVLWLDWMPNGKEIMFAISQNGRPSRIWVQEIASGKSRPVTDEGVEVLLYSHLISPDSRVIIGRAADGSLHLYPFAGGPPEPLPYIEPGEQPLRWSADGKSLYVYTPGALPARIDLVRLSDGHRQMWKDLVPNDTAGVAFIRAPLITPDGRHYVYSYTRVLSDLFLVRGLR